MVPLDLITPWGNWIVIQSDKGLDQLQFTRRHLISILPSAEPRFLPATPLLSFLRLGLFPHKHHYENMKKNGCFCFWLGDGVLI